MQLLTSAATGLALHDVARRQTIIVETSELLQKHATSNEMIDLDTHNLCVTVAELDDPESFLETDRGAAFVKSIVSDLYYERYERHRDRKSTRLNSSNSSAHRMPSSS